MSYDYDPTCYTQNLTYAMCKLCYLFKEAVAFDIRQASHGDSIERDGRNIVNSFKCYLADDGVDMKSINATIFNSVEFFTGILTHMYCELEEFALVKFVSFCLIDFIYR